MNKLFVLISSLIGLVCGAAVSLITYFEPANASIINGAIELGSSTAITIVGMFLNNQAKNKENK